MRLRILFSGAVIAIIAGAVYLTASTFGQRCARLHPGADEHAIALCVEDLRDPIAAAKRASYQEGYRDGIVTFARLLGVEPE